MIGRAAYQNPELLLDVDPWNLRRAGAASPTPSRRSKPTSPTSRANSSSGARLADMTRHLLGLFAGRPGARAYRQRLSMLATRPGAGLATLAKRSPRSARAPLAAAE